MGGTLALAAPAVGAGWTRADGIPQPVPELIDRARSALIRHSSVITHRDVVGIVDFGASSQQPRFFLHEIQTGRTLAFLVAHGRGSDPDHCGWVERFSNVPGSEASSQGAYLIGADYQGRHGLSRKVAGLDAMNSNAARRAIVIHSAPYVSAEIASEHQKLGRSEGCFAVSRSDLPVILSRLVPGSLLYADKLPSLARVRSAASRA